MIRRLTGLALAALLLLPRVALAADPSPIAPAGTGHYYVLAALELGGTMVKSEGKLWIDGGKLGVSVGCNSIGATATFDGKVLTLTSGITTTEMGCPADIAAIEAALVKALGAGPFTWDGNTFNGMGARITAREVTTGPATPPDAVVVDPGLPFDPVACKDLVSAEVWAAAFGSGGSVGVTSSGSVASPGSVPGSGPAAGSGSGSASGSGGSGTTGTAGAGATTQIAPAPLPAQSAGARPLVPPAGSPAPVPSAAVAPGTNAVPPSTGIAVPPPAVDLPPASGATTVPAPITKDGPAVMPGPGATPSPELCRELLSRVSVMVSNGMAMPKAGVQATLGTGLVEGDMASVRDAAGTRIGGPAAAILALVVGLLLVGWMRSLASAPVGRTER